MSQRPREPSPVLTSDGRTAHQVVTEIAAILTSPEARYFFATGDTAQFDPYGLLLNLVDFLELQGFDCTEPDSPLGRCHPFLHALLRETQTLVRKALQLSNGTDR